ncbi:SDR family NAD(P)-dependent oxidoreductase [Jannaschia sp. 2305UL9-9]|uniref:SDR family NAD(P)-dependent oxidoreductase n=1 Tax=Jannaschia sp. 2305UL9-9 TaxID=3121638 RepID=UPI003526DD46
MRVLITGASRGIGAAMVSEGEARGHTVIGTTRDGDMPLDVTDPAAQARVAENTGPLDLLVCNAGVFVDRDKTLETITADDLTTTFAANVTGVLLTVQAQMRNLSKGGRIAIISSQMGSSQKANGNAFAYRASKAAAVNLGLNLAANLQDAEIAVGIYHPGWVQTDMGGDSAAITPAASAKGLWDRFEGLTLATTGRFETYDGQPHPI